MQQHNLFIDSLPDASRRLLLSKCQPGLLPANTALYECEEHPRSLYFLTSGIAAVVSSTPDGNGLEMGLIGREGFSGSLHLLGKGLVPTRCFMLTEGSALRMSSATFKILFDSDAEIRMHALEFVQNQMLTLSQLASCNRFHGVEQRLARTLLMLLDRAILIRSLSPRTSWRNY